MSVGQLEDTLGRNFSELSPKLKVAARYVIDNPQDVATRSLRQVAKRSGLTPPTFSRLARAVGFAEYECLRDVCRQEMKLSSLSLAQRAVVMQQDNPATGTHSRGSFAEVHALSAVENINRLVQGLDLEKLADVADRLSSAGKVRLIGALSSKAILEYLLHMANLAAPNWLMIGQDGTPAPTALADFDRDTVVLVVSLSPYVKRTVEMTRLAKAAGSDVVVVTDDLAAPVLKYASSSFLISTESPQFFPSYVAVVTLLEMLMGMTVRRLGDKANKRIDSVEKLSRAIGDYI
ncbi:MAG: MurR/RpiR family transcriptional regulator [Rhizobiaceae bacterium]